ncbi:MAG TPA: tripartite tricarboxylate transporter substrate binding protein [Burkholderiales bacterium]|nr:tripartite tricarboxylate transporter substrate binding protein [Burkholderiales bacterium]
MKHLLLAAASLLAGLMPAAHSIAQQAGEYPARPIRWIIPFPPGGSNDMLGRFLGTKLTERVNQQVVIDNRGGANGIIGAELAANAPADGYTLILVSTSWVMNAAVRTLTYDVEKSFDPITMIGSSPNSIVVYPGLGIKSLGELVQRAKAKPGAISYASTGVGGFNHFGGELFKKTAGVDMVHVPYKGGGPAMIDVMAGNMPVMFTSITQVLSHVRSGKIQMLAVGAAKRSSAVPDIPTVAESGYPRYEVAVWWGISAPAGTPRPIMEKLRREYNAILAEPATRSLLAGEAADSLSLTPAEFRQFVHNEKKKWTDVAKQAGIRVQ